MRKVLSVISAVALFLIVGWLIYSGTAILTDFWTELAVGLTLLVFGILYWGFKPEIIRLVKGKKEEPDVLIKENSLHFNKYPYLLVSSSRRVQPMTNMVYAEITIENRGNAKAKECEVEILLRGKENYRSKVLSADSTKTPNPMTVSVDAVGGTIGFHPLCLELSTLEVVLPNHSLGKAGVFTGTLVKHGEYEVLGKVLHDGRQSKIVSLGKVEIPNGLLEKAKIPNDIQVIIDQGGFAVYVERYQGKARAKFCGHHNDSDIKRIVQEYFGKIPQIDNVIEDNGRIRTWQNISL